MRSDLDSLMRARGIGALVVSMHETADASFRWMTRGAKVTRGYVVKIRGEEPLLLHYPMERDEARAAGVATRSVHDFGYHEIFRAATDAAKAYGELFDRVLRELGATGAVAFYGNAPIHLYFPILEELERKGHVVYRSRGDELIQLARKTKEPWELDVIRSVGERTEEVVETVREVLRSSTISGGVTHYRGEPLTIGYLKQLVSSEIYRRGMIEDHETILSHGRDAAIPHSRGDASAFVREGVPIVLDIFPADRASGYFFDLTRTFCVGAVPRRLAEIHALVLEAFSLAATEMRAGTPARDYQRLVCEFFEAKGFRTTRSDAATVDGYVHSLGHGVGLQVHERPSFSLLESNHDVIEVGDVVTIEPGLYFPDEEIGVRIEDTFFIDRDGKAVAFSTSSRRLEP